MPSAPRSTARVALVVLLTLGIALAGLGIAYATAAPGGAAHLDAPIVTVLSAARDTYIHEWYPSNNYGAAPLLDVSADDVAAILIAFDPAAAVPVGAQIESASLQLYAVSQTTPIPLTVGAYAVYRLWEEYAAAWTRAVTDSPWSLAGCNDEYTDRAASPSASAVVSAVSQWYALDVTALVRSWVQDPYGNQGIVLKAFGDATTVRFASREHATAEYRPKLVLTYTVPTPTPSPTAWPYDSGVYVQFDSVYSNLDASHGYPVAGGHARPTWQNLEYYADDAYRFDDLLLPWIEGEMAAGKKVGVGFTTFNGRWDNVAVPEWLYTRDPAVRLDNGGFYVLNYLNRTYVDEYAEFIQAFAQWVADTPTATQQIAWVETGIGLWGENQPTAKSWDNQLDWEYYANVAPGGTNPGGGWTSVDWISHCNEIIQIYRDAFDAAGLTDMPIMTNIAPTFRASWERDVISDYAASIGVGLKHAGLLADHNNAAASYAPIVRYSEHPTVTVPVAWETYGLGWGLTAQEWYWTALAGLAKHPDYFVSTRDLLQNAEYLPTTGLAARYSGVDRDTTPDVWVALRETFRRDTWDNPEFGNYSFWLEQDDEYAGGHTVTETYRNDSVTSGLTNRLGLPVYNPALPATKESWTTRRTSQGDGNPYMWFDIDDGYLSDLTPVVVEVTYLDTGMDTWSLRYRGKGGEVEAVPDGGSDPWVSKTGSNTWQVATFTIADGLFADGLSGAHDLRIDCRGDGDEWVHLVKARRTGPSSPVPHTVSVSPEGGYAIPGILQSFTGVYHHAEGYQELANLDLLINTTESMTQCVYLRYDAQANSLWIRRPDDASWQGGGAPGSTDKVSNVYVTLNYGLSTVAKDADTITVTWAITPTYRNSGDEHNLYLRAADLDGLSTPWVNHGAFIINRTPNYLIPPVVTNLASVGGAKLAADVIVVPCSKRMTFNPRYRDLDGWSNLATLYFAIADAPPTGDMGPNAVFLKYDQLANKVYLANTEGTDWGIGYAPKSDFILDNSAVKVVVKWSYPGVADVRTRIMYWRLEFLPNYVGSHKLFMRAVDLFPKANGDTGWKWKGALTVTP